MNGLKEPQNPSVHPHKSQPTVAEAPVLKYSFPKSQIRVLLLENIHSSALNLLRAEGFQVETVPKSLSEDELIDRLEGVHLLGIRSKTRLSARVLEAASRLLAIGCFCIGTDQVSLSHAESLGIPVFNAPFSNTRSVAELVLGEIIALSRRLMDNAANMHKGIWQKSASGCTEVRGKVLGIIGYGHIGSQLSVLAENLGMRIIFYDVRTVLPMGNGRAMAGLEHLLRDADFVSLHVPKSNATNRLIGARELSLMKPGAYLINASRGTVVDIDALAHSLKTRHLAGAAVDVFPVEPAKNGPGFESPLRGLENVILTPHIAGSTAEAQRNIGTEVATALIRFVNEGCTASAVNFPQLEMPQTKDCHRILNVHNNVPGVLSAINAIVSKTGSNIRMQILGTSNAIGYTIMDINKEASVDTKKAIKALPESIATRILY